MTWQILIKQLWFWRIVWNLKTNLSHVLNPYTFDFWIFYFMHFEVLSMNFEIFNVLSSLFVHICIVSFQKKISSTFWITLFIWFCWCNHVLFLLWYELSFQSNISCLCFVFYHFVLVSKIFICFVFCISICFVMFLFINLVMKILPLYFKS